MSISIRLARFVTVPVIGGAVVALVATVAAGSPAGAADGEVSPSFPSGTPIVQKHISAVPNTTGIDGVQAYDTKGYPAPGPADSGAIDHAHVHGPVTYSVTAPVGGPHNEKWLNAGVYTEPVPSSRAVHDLEHGAVWITYRPGLSQTELTALYAFVHRQTLLDEGLTGSGTSKVSNRFVVMSPWASDSLGAPIAITSWGYKLKVQSASDPRLQQFVDKFRRSATYSPESDAPVDGMTVTVGGRPARDGSVYTPV